jgi:hypothetical protein
MPTDASQVALQTRIYKYTVPVDDQDHLIAFRGPIVHVASQAPNEVQLWVQYNPHADKHRWKFRVVGTGQPIPNGMLHVGTAFDGPFVWHLVRDLA